MEDQIAQETLAREHMALVDEIVAVMLKRFGGGVDAEEVRSFALDGLAAAIRRYDPSRNIAFRTFAAPRIKGAIYDGFAKASWFPRRLQRKIAFFRRTEELLRYPIDDPRPADSVEAVHRLANTLKDLAAAYVTAYVAEGEVNEPVSSPAQAEDALERKRCTVKLNASIKALPEKQEKLIRYYFYEDMSLAQIADRLGHDKSWVSRLLKAALANLRNTFDEQSIPVEVFEQSNE